MNTERAISEIMTNGLVTVYPDTSAKKVLDIFKQNEFHHIPVVEKGEMLVGIISKEDFFRVSYILSQQTTGKTWTEKEYESMTAKEFMTEYPMTLAPEDTIGLAADIFLNNKFHALPVVEDQRLVGIVTSHDLLRYGFDSYFVEKEGEDDDFQSEGVSSQDDENELF
jgi:CBS domain-containing protein